MRRAGLLAYGAVLVLFAVLVAAPFLTKQRDTPAAVPSPRPLAYLTLDSVPGGGRLCMADMTMSRQSGQVAFQATTEGKPRPPLGLTLSAPGYSASARVPAGWKDNALLRLHVPQPAHDQLVTACLRNAGRDEVKLFAAGDSAQSRVVVNVGNTRVFPTPVFMFYPSRTRSIAQNSGLTATRIATFRGVFDHAFLVWALAALCVIGVPLMIGVALWSATPLRWGTVRKPPSEGSLQRPDSGAAFPSNGR